MLPTPATAPSAQEHCGSAVGLGVVVGVTLAPGEKTDVSGGVPEFVLRTGHGMGWDGMGWVELTS